MVHICITFVEIELLIAYQRLAMLKLLENRLSSRLLWRILALHSIREEILQSGKRTPARNANESQRWHRIPTPRAMAQQPQENHEWAHAH